MNRIEKLREKQLNEFLDDVKNHTMKVIKDDFPYCHLEFSNRGSSIYKFSIITAPGTILVKGDMGDYVFTTKNENPFVPFDLDLFDSIDYEHYQEKLLLCEGREGSREYCPKLYREAVKKLAIGYANNSIKDPEERKEFYLNAMDDLVLSRNCFEIEDTIKDAWDYGYMDDLPFDSIYGMDLMDLKYHFVWCCNAIVWATLYWKDWKVSA